MAGRKRSCPRLGLDSIKKIGRWTVAAKMKHHLATGHLDSRCDLQSTQPNRVHSQSYVLGSRSMEGDTNLSRNLPNAENVRVPFWLPLG